jgi:hypothetical protein
MVRIGRSHKVGKFARLAPAVIHFSGGEGWPFFAAQSASARRTIDAAGMCVFFDTPDSDERYASVPFRLMMEVWTGPLVALGPPFFLAMTSSTSRPPAPSPALSRAGGRRQRGPDRPGRWKDGPEPVTDELATLTEGLDGPTAGDEWGLRLRVPSGRELAGLAELLSAGTGEADQRDYLAATHDAAGEPADVAGYLDAQAAHYAALGTAAGSLIARTLRGLAGEARALHTFIDRPDTAARDKGYQPSLRDRSGPPCPAPRAVPIGGLYPPSNCSRRRGLRGAFVASGGRLVAPVGGGICGL